jgi:sec-independent protein translocase protein TatC
MAVQPPVQAPPPPPPQQPPPQRNQDARMLTILEHLQELRYRLMICAGALLVTVSASFYPLSKMFIRFLEQPAKDRVANFQLVFTEPLEFWTSYFKVSLLLGIAMAMPVIVYQILAFVSPGLTKAERRWLYPIVIGASVSFLAGCTFAYYVELPPALKFLLGNTGGVEAQPLMRIQSYIDFVTRLILVTGLVFELPLFVMGLAKIGVVRSGKLLGWWRHAIIIAFVAAAIVTPSIDPITQSLVAGPMIGLYFLGIVLAKFVEGAPLIQR